MQDFLFDDFDLQIFRDTVSCTVQRARWSRKLLELVLLSEALLFETPGLKYRRRG